MAQTGSPDIVLQGKVSGTQNKTYFEIPFQVPARVHRISVNFGYTGKDHKTTLDLGIADPERFRGNSGGNKIHFTIGESDATPSYLPGAIPPGRWRLLISVPNIRPTEQDAYRAEIRFNSREEDESFSSTPLETGLRWYRGDLHMHTAHSDGSCASQSGKRVPCPLFLTAQTAVSQQLDFIAITDHNATSQYNDMRELQPYFDRLLLIPGREITTFWGHFNIFGTTRYVDYRAVAHGGRSVDDILRDVRAYGGIASVNHADAPSGEICMGCGWRPSTPADMSLFSAVEVINGGGSMLSSTDFWDRQLANGVRLTGIGGSDNHNAPEPAGKPGSIGWPTTVVQASELSVPAILQAIQRGRVFVDLTASNDKLLDIDACDMAPNSARTKPNCVEMGGTLQAGQGQSIAIRVHVRACPGCAIYRFIDGHEMTAVPPLPNDGGDQDVPFNWLSDGNRHWLRVEVRDPAGHLALVSNPIYINFNSTHR